MEWWNNLDNATRITLITLVITNIVTIISIIISYIQKISEIKLTNSQAISLLEKEKQESRLDSELMNNHTMALLEKEKQESRLDSKMNLYIETIQRFAYVAGHILTSIETKNKDSERIPFDTLSKFDESYYKAYILLDDYSDKQVFRDFQYKVRRLAGLPKPDGVDIFEEHEEFEKILELQSEGYSQIPQPIYADLEKCLDICNELLVNILK